MVVEDDPLIASSLVRALTSRGYEPYACTSVAEARRSIAERLPELVLLDLGLPDGDGTEIATELAARHPAVPVLALTARSDEIDVVLGLEAGAVDYIVKPFRLAELLARIDAHLRMAGAVRRGRRREGRTITVGDIEIDAAARRVRVAGAELGLRPREFDLLERLARDAGVVVSREELIDDVWDENWWGSTRTLDVHINSIRRKIGDRAGEPSRITTVRGVGYRLEDRR